MPCLQWMHRFVRVADVPKAVTSSEKEGQTKAEVTTQASSGCEHLATTPNKRVHRKTNQEENPEITTPAPKRKSRALSEDQKEANKKRKLEAFNKQRDEYRVQAVSIHAARAFVARTHGISERNVTKKHELWEEVILLTWRKGRSLRHQISPSRLEARNIAG